MYSLVKSDILIYTSSLSFSLLILFKRLWILLFLESKSLKSISFIFCFICSSVLSDWSFGLFNILSGLPCLPCLPGLTGSVVVNSMPSLIQILSGNLSTCSLHSESSDSFSNFIASSLFSGTPFSNLKYSIYLSTDSALSLFFISFLVVSKYQELELRISCILVN